jgi:ComF family protein
MSDESTATAEGRGSKLLRRLNAVAAAALDWVYPPHCRGCEEPLPPDGNRTLCPDCRAALADARVGEARCETCGVPFPHVGPEASCTRCIIEGRHFDKARAFAVYRNPMDTLVRTFKFRGDYALGPHVLRRLLAEDGLPDNIGDGADVVVPVPLHARRRRERGYDQAELLARVIARHLGLPLHRKALVRKRYTSQQSLLVMNTRWDNVRGAFEIGRSALPPHCNVLLVDDVITTGATISECARVLKRAGAARVHALALARAGL